MIKPNLIWILYYRRLTKLNNINIIESLIILELESEPGVSEPEPS